MDRKVVVFKMDSKECEYKQSNNRCASDVSLFHRCYIEDCPYINIPIKCCGKAKK